MLPLVTCARDEVDDAVVAEQATDDASASSSAEPAPTSDRMTVTMFSCSTYECTIYIPKTKTFLTKNVPIHFVLSHHHYSNNTISYRYWVQTYGFGDVNVLLP